ncbi:hypothetical protein H6P81_007045 [Aristolochia fimbriata]|uniref:Proteasome assembly chaperone 3 n=1 Tax=Aristolochia fimbriata TaxID=158543 RepID=A0AAV7F2R5_ARIFI|nr:hypothetical protein H6P81_007045 [Aristolochia fimbriata]
MWEAASILAWAMEIGVWRQEERTTQPVRQVPTAESAKTISKTGPGDALNSKRKAEAHFPPHSNILVASADRSLLLSLSSHFTETLSIATHPLFRTVPSPLLLWIMEETCSFTVPTKMVSADIKGIKTNVIVSSYDDHFLIIATQIGSMGTILYARKEETVSADPVCDVSIIFGKRDEPMLISCARELIELISRTSSKPLVISLGIKDHSPETLKAIVARVRDIRLW